MKKNAVSDTNNEKVYLEPCCSKKLFLRSLGNDKLFGKLSVWKGKGFTVFYETYSV